jgi:hypothetical protein
VRLVTVPVVGRHTQVKGLQLSPSCNNTAMSQCSCKWEDATIRPLEYAGQWYHSVQYASGEIFSAGTWRKLRVCTS